VGRLLLFGGRVLARFPLCCVGVVVCVALCCVVLCCVVLCCVELCVLLRCVLLCGLWGVLW